MVCKIFEYVVLYVEEVKKGDMFWDDLFLFKLFCCNILNICIMFYIVKIEDVQGYLYCIYCLIYVDCLMCFRDDIVMIGGMRKRIQGSICFMYMMLRKMSGWKVYMYCLVNILFFYGYIFGFIVM